MKRRKRFNLLRLKRIAGNITSDEVVWLAKNPKAKHSTYDLLSKGYYIVRHLPTSIKNKITSIHKASVRAKEKAKNKKEFDSKWPKRIRTLGDYGRPIEDSRPPVKFTNIAKELGDPAGISRSLTDNMYLTDPKEEITLNNIPPAKC